MSRSAASIWPRLLKWGITLMALSYVAWRLWEEHADLSEGWKAVQRHPGYFVAAILLVVLNIGSEAEKWRMMVSRIYPEVGRRTAFKAVLAGMASGIFTPNRIGEYAGRVLFLRAGKRVEAVFATFLDRICQLAVTLFVGTVALSFAIRQDNAIFDPAFDRVILTLAWISLGLVLLFLLFPHIPTKLIPSRFSEKPESWLGQLRHAPETLDRTLLLRILLLSALRYAVFSTQFVLLLLAFELTSDLALAYFLIALFFLLKSLVPVLGIMELGLRETVALQVFGWAGMGAAGIVQSTFLLYLINIVLPTLAGVVALWSLNAEKGGGAND